MIDAADGITYIGCVRAGKLAGAGVRSYYRVTVAFSVWNFLTSLDWSTSFAAVLAELGGNLQAQSGDSIALVDPVPTTVDTDATPVTVDVMTLGNATQRTVGDMVAAFEAAAPVAVSRVELISSAVAHAGAREVARDDVSRQQQQQDKADSPLTAITDTAEKIVLVVVAVCVLLAWSIILPKRQ